MPSTAPRAQQEKPALSVGSEGDTPGARLSIRIRGMLVRLHSRHYRKWCVEETTNDIEWKTAAECSRCLGERITRSSWNSNFGLGARKLQLPQFPPLRLQYECLPTGVRTCAEPDVHTDRLISSLFDVCNYS